jgi:hypothetical protein
VPREPRDRAPSVSADGNARAGALSGTGPRVFDRPDLIRTVVVIGPGQPPIRRTAVSGMLVHSATFTTSPLCGACTMAVPPTEMPTWLTGL